MSAHLVQAPAIEPVSPAELRDWLKIDTTDEDATLAALVTAARLALEGHARRAFISQTWRFIYASSMPDGTMRLPLAPLASLVALRVYDAAGVATTAAPAMVELDLDDQRPAVRLVDADLLGRAARFEVEVVVGYGAAAGDVPATVRQAIRMLAAAWHGRRGDATPQDGARLPPDVAALIGPLRRTRLA
ncbi:MAG: hypothetical protein JNK46_20305 [Methylobacteriaceae bacterium]|nr:hypothetical protein [Methylobacteriaceae bacterium]